MDTSPTPPYVQVVEVNEMTPNGEIVRKIQVLREGDVIKLDGHHFRIVKNALGTLYKQSIDPRGQVGNQPAVDPTELVKQYQEATQQALKAHSESVNDVAEMLVERSRGEEESSSALHVQDISAGFRNRYGLGLTLANQIVKPATLFIEGEQTYLILCGSVRVRDQYKRNAAIDHLLGVINDLAERGLVKSILAPLSSMMIGRDEVIFYFIHVPGDEHQKIREAHPDLFLPEGEIPTKPFEG
jgi:hypothetical protein